jgi:hypothetical protein
MKQALFLTFSVLILTLGCFAQTKKIESIYTSTLVKDCKTIEQDNEGAGYYRGECPGVGGYKIELIEGDIRQTINMIAPNGTSSELNFWSTVSGGFSAVGEKAEWRITRNGKKVTPFALIIRYNAQNPETEKNDSFLVVVKITGNSACVTEIIKPTANQNVKAREAADNSANKPCVTSE